jgi:hypothetical protein
MSWCPPSGFEELNGCIWLPRLVSKARRVLELRGGNLIGEYMFGENDPADGALLRFLGLSSTQVLDVVGSEPNDRDAAARLLQMTGKTTEQCRRFTRQFRLTNGPFLAMMDADENRTAPGVKASLLRWIYNRIIMPPAYAHFRRMENKRKSYGQAGT